MWYDVAVMCFAGGTALFALALLISLIQAFMKTWRH